MCRILRHLGLFILDLMQRLIKSTNILDIIRRCLDRQAATCIGYRVHGLLKENCGEKVTLPNVSSQIKAEDVIQEQEPVKEQMPVKELESVEEQMPVQEIEPVEELEFVEEICCKIAWYSSSELILTKCPPLARQSS